MPTLKQFISDLEKLVVEVSGLGTSPLLLNTNLNVRQIVDKVFSVEFSTLDTGKERGKDRIYLGHEVSISYINKVDPHNQIKARDTSLEQEELLVKSILDSSKLPEYRIRYKATTRSLSTNRDYYLTKIIIVVEHYWNLK